MIESEEDAERALRLSSALTQKLLAYRFKTVSSVSCYHTCTCGEKFCYGVLFDHLANFEGQQISNQQLF